MDKIDLSDLNNKDKNQTEIFEDAFLRNLKGMQARIKQHHVQDAEQNSGDMKYIGDSTKKLVELKLLELDTVISARQKEEEWIRKREIRAAQSDRIAQARANLSTLLTLEQAGKCGLEDDIEDNLAILREVSNIGGEDIHVKEDTPNADKILDSFHVTEKDLKRAFHKTNILDIMRQAKQNGWTMKISEDEIALYNKSGKRICDSVNHDFVGEDIVRTVSSPIKGRSKVARNAKTTKTVKTAKAIKRK